MEMQQVSLLNRIWIIVVADDLYSSYKINHLDEINSKLTKSGVFFDGVVLIMLSLVLLHFCLHFQFTFCVCYFRGNAPHQSRFIGREKKMRTNKTIAIDFTLKMVSFSMFYLLFIYLHFKVIIIEYIVFWGGKERKYVYCSLQQYERVSLSLFRSIFLL